MISVTFKQTLSEHRAFLLVLAATVVAAGVLAVFAAVDRTSWQPVIIWLATAEVALLGATLLDKDRTPRRNWIVVGTFGGILLCVGFLLLLLA